MLQFLLLPLVAAQFSGVGPDFLQHYQKNTPKFHCISDPSIELDWSQVNDNYCDCPDGSDEPGTAACPQGQFWCANEGFLGQYIPSYLVGDGVCDYDVCCDGSDEAPGVCPNRCVELNQQFNEYKQLVHDQVQAAIGRQSTMKALAKAGATKELEQVKQFEQELQKLEREARPVSDNRQSQVAAVSEYLEWQALQIRQFQDILATMMDKYNPNYNDAAVKDAIAKFQRLASNSNPPTVPDVSKLGGTNDEPNLSNMIHHYMKKVTDSFGQTEEILVEYPERYHQIKQMLDRYNAHKINYGEDDILRAATNTVSTEFGGYTYKVEYLKGIWQDDTVIGRFNGFNPDTNTLSYVQGDKCWNGPHRLATIHLVCGPEEAVVGVSEPNKCGYALEMTHPMACREMTEEELSEAFSIDWDRL